MIGAEAVSGELLTRQFGLLQSYTYCHGVFFGYGPLQDKSVATTILGEEARGTPARLHDFSLYRESPFYYAKPNIGSLINGIAYEINPRAEERLDKFHKLGKVFRKNRAFIQDSRTSQSYSALLYFTSQPVGSPAAAVAVEDIYAALKIAKGL